jgi:hypothetical protein
MSPEKVDDEKRATTPQEDGPPDYSVQPPAQQLPPDLSERLGNLKLDALNGVCTSSLAETQYGGSRYLQPVRQASTSHPIIVLHT